MMYPMLHEADWKVYYHKFTGLWYSCRFTNADGISYKVIYMPKENDFRHQYWHIDQDPDLTTWRDATPRKT